MSLNITYILTPQKEIRELYVKKNKSQNLINKQLKVQIKHSPRLKHFDILNSF